MKGLGRRSLLILLLLGAAVVTFARPVAAQPAPSTPHWRLDDRYQHGRYYPAPGSHTVRLPERSIPIAFHGDRYYVNSGVWFRDSSRGYVVSLAPVGAFVPVLPPGFTTVIYGGIPYYYANDVYYAGAVAAPGYLVVAPPEGAEPRVVESSTEAQVELQVAPLRGQDQVQLFNDRADCSREATAVSGFDPTRPWPMTLPIQPTKLSGMAPVASSRTDYRAVEVQCLAARGYGIR